MDDLKKRGVYLIRNTINNTVYVGSTAQTFEQRWREHRSNLGLNKGRNRHLQNAWEKYGPNAFNFSILEIIDQAEDVIEAEQRWIDYYVTQSVPMYNHVYIAGSQLGLKHSAETRLKMSASIRQHYQEHPETRDKVGTATKQMWSQPGRREKRSQSAKAFWRSRENKGKLTGKYAKIYAFVSPDGQLYQDIVCLRDLCDQHGLSPSAMSLVFDGKRANHKGWTRYSEGQEVQPYTQPLRIVGATFTAIAPDGTRYEQITNVEAFGREHGLDASALRKVAKGRYKHHHGWLCYPEPSE